MSWETKRILVVAKAYPETSTKHGSVVCTAGITDAGDWVRLYPIPFELFTRGSKLHRYSIIECECKKATGEKLRRKESHKVRPGSIRIVDSSLYNPADWEARSRWILPHLSVSVERLNEMFEEDHTTLGFIKPKEIQSFYRTHDLEIFDVDNREFQITIDGKRTPILTRIPHIFKYRFSCQGCGPGAEHNIQCEDWELLESYRKWGVKYKDPDVLWEKIHAKFFDSMVEEKDLHFFMGMHSQFPSWLIIGLYYPPKIASDEDAKFIDKSIFEFNESSD